MLVKELQTFLSSKLGEVRMKTLSIIIPMYNTSKSYFEKCLISLLCEQQKEIEVIVVDDGSQEQYSRETKKHIESSPLDIKYFKKKNGGQNSAREYGLAHATGRYVFFMDADDYVDSDALDKIISLLKKYKPVILAFNYDVRTSDDVILEEHNRWKGEYKKVDVNKGLLYSDSLCLQIYDRDAFYKSGIHLVQGVRIGEDMASSTALLATIETEYATDTCLYHYIKHPGSALSNPSEESALDMIHAFEAMLAQLDTSIQTQYYVEFEWLAILHILYYNTMRILKSYGGNKAYIKEIKKWMRNNYPNWKENTYIRTENIATKWSFVLIKNDHTKFLFYLQEAKKKMKKLFKKRQSK